MLQFTRLACLATALLAFSALTACQSSQPAGPASAGPDRMTQAYDQGRYDLAYDLASDQRHGGSMESRRYAEYIAGMSAWRLGERTKATKHLERASKDLYPPRNDDDRASYGQVMSALGMVYAEMGDHTKAADRFMRGAPYLEGEDQANAYYYAGISLQKLDRQPDAVTQFRLAEAATQDSGLASDIQDRLSASGFTLQFGAYGMRANAVNLAQTIATKTANLNVGPPLLVDAIDERTGKQVTLVQLGLFTDYRSAQQAKSQIGDANAIIVQRNGRVGG